MKRIIQLVVLLFVIAGSALKEEVMELAGRNVLNLIIKDTEFEQYKSDSLLIKVVPELLKNAQIYKDKIENTLLKDSVDFLYKHNGQYYLLHKRVSQYYDTKELMQGQESKEYQKFRAVIKKTRKLPCLFTIRRAGKTILETEIELDVFI